MDSQGIRVRDGVRLDLSRVCYWDKDGEWFLYLPGCGIGSLREHEVVEHEDGTITVQPSILMTGHNQGQETTVHGYLERGVWRGA
jgi:hypothetical protein